MNERTRSLVRHCRILYKGCPFAVPRVMCECCVSQSYKLHVLLCFLIFAKLLGQKWHLGVLLIFILVMRSEFEHFILCLGSKTFILMRSLSFAHFLIRFWTFLPCSFRVYCTSGTVSLYWWYMLKPFSSSFWAVFWLFMLWQFKRFKNF